MVDASDPGLATAIADIRNDKTPTDWVHIGYEGRNKVKAVASGSGGFEEIRVLFKDDECSWGFIRVVTGDQESRRIKFVFLVWAGPKVGAMSKSRFCAHKPSVSAAVGQFHVELFADDPADFTMEEILDKLKRSAGANYDLGSNAKGYASQIGDIKANAASSYKAAEKEQTIGPVVYEKGALASATPCDLGGRRMVAPPTEAKKNTDLVGKLDQSKIALEEPRPADASKTTQPAPAPAAKPAVEEQRIVDPEPAPAAAPEPEPTPAPAAEEPAPAAEEPAAEEPAAEEPAAEAAAEEKAE